MPLAVHIVDDDEGMRRTIARIVGAAGYPVHEYSSGDAFLAEAASAAPGCVVLDLDMPGVGGLRVQQILSERQIALSVLILTGHGDVGAAVEALKGGAVDFLQKPFRRQQLIEAVEAAHRRLELESEALQRREEARARIDLLSPREKETLEELRRGLAHKVVAYNLGISIRTVEEHRARILRKLEVRSLSEALQILFDAG